MRLLPRERINGLSMNRVVRGVIKLQTPPGEAELELLHRTYGRLSKLPDRQQQVQ